METVIYGGLAMGAMRVAPAKRYDVCMHRADDIETAIATHADTVMRVCSVYLRERADREDAFQETFLRLARKRMKFADDEHRKAWLIRVASNVCKDMLKSSAAKTESLDIDERYRLPLYLKFYEGYTAAEIASTLKIPENTVYTNISRGKQQLKGVLSHGRTR